MLYKDKGRSGQGLVDVWLDLREVVYLLLVLILDGEVLELLLGLLLFVGLVVVRAFLGLEMLVALEGWRGGLAHLC